VTPIFDAIEGPSAMRGPSGGIMNPSLPAFNGGGGGGLAGGLFGVSMMAKPGGGIGSLLYSQFGSIILANGILIIGGTSFFLISHIRKSRKLKKTEKSES
jgi:hypothetical protein